jgi:flagellar hook-length control protein FliK
MAQIDLLSLLKATGAPSAAGAGSNLAAKSTTSAGLFEQILSGQTGGAAPAISGGNGLPAGNSLPTNAMSMLQQTQSSQQLLATLSPQQQSQIDDLSFITQLQPVIDMPQTPVAAAVSQFADSKVDFSDQQLQDLATQLGIDPAIASLVLQSTVKPATNGGSLNAQTSAAIGMGFKPGQAQVVATTNVLDAAAETTVKVLAQPQVQVQPQVPAQVQPQVQAQVQPQVQPQVQVQVQVQPPLQGQPQAATSAQALATRSLDSLPLNDADVIKVRSQHSTAAANTAAASSTASPGGTPSALALTPQVATQSFLQQRQTGAVSQVPDKKTQLANSINKVLTQTKAKAASATGSNAATTYAAITLAPSLVQKLDQLTGLASAATNATNSLESQALGSYTGANFKAASSLANVPTAVGVVLSSDAATMDLGQRFTSLMQGDSSAQLAARQMQDQLGQQLHRMVKEGRWQANLSLNPARLGQVSINLVMEDGVLQTQLLSANAGVRELLESSLPRLKEQLEDSGLQLSGVSVGSDNRGQQQARGEEPDWQLSQTVRNSNEEQTPMGAANNRSNHDGDIDTFA